MAQAVTGAGAVSVPVTARAPARVRRRAGGRAPGREPAAAAQRRQPGALSGSDTDFESGLTGTAHWQDIDEEDDCPDSVCGEPGEKYWKILQNIVHVLAYCTLFEFILYILYGICACCTYLH